MTKVNANNGNEENQIFFHGAYSNLIPYLYLSKNIKISTTFKIMISQFYD